MGGSGGGGFFSGEVNPEHLAESVRRSEEESEDQSFSTEVSQLLGDVLSQYNDRDTEGIQAILEQVKSELSDELEDTVDLVFGGSVAKHTYIDGLSDIDALVVLKDVHAESAQPEQLIGLFADKLRARYGDSENVVKEGRLSVTLHLKEKSIQLLPAVRDGDRFKIASANGKEWSEIRPKKFAKKLTESNQRLDGKLVPVIKLAKSINSTLPEQRQLSGYHIEAMAINVFKAYDGPKNSREMLKHFFKQAPDYCKRPIRDSTGQSVHVDGSLGSENSIERRVVADAYGRIGRRLENADNARQIQQWKSALGIQ